jgi:hypothetical protein
MVGLSANKRLYFIDFVCATGDNAGRDNLVGNRENPCHKCRVGNFKKSGNATDTDALLYVVDDVSVNMRFISDISVFALLLSQAMFTFKSLFTIILTSVLNAIASTKFTSHFFLCPNLIHEASFTEATACFRPI